MWQEHRPHHVQRYMQQNPYRLLALSFLAVMTVGTLLLMLPIASAQGQDTALVDAAFTAVSCVSVSYCRHLLSLVVVWQARHGHPYSIGWAWHCILYNHCGSIIG